MKKGGSVAAKATRNSLYSMLANGWYLLSRFLLTPFILHHLTLAEYGLWSLCFVVISFLALTSTGIEATYIKYVAEFHARQEIERVNRLLSTGLLLTCLLSLLLLTGLWLGMGLILDLMKIEPELRRMAGMLFMGTGLVFMLDISFNCFGRALDGMQYMALTAKVRMFTSFLELILIVAFLLAGFGVHGMMLAFLARYLLAILINMLFAYRLVPGLSIAPRYCDLPSLKLLVSYGGKMQVLGLFGMFMSTFDRLVITRMLGLAATGMYEIGRKIPFTGARLPSDISGAVMPALSQLQGQNDMSQARTLFLDASRYMAILTAILFTYFMAVAPWAIQAWLGEGYQQAVAVMYVVSAGKLVHLLTGASSAAARGLARLDWEMRYSIINVLLCVLMIPPLAYSLGLLGAALGVAGSTAIASCYFIVTTNRYFAVSLSAYTRQVLHPILACLLSGFVLFVMLTNYVPLTGYPRFWLICILAGAGGGYFVLAAFLLWATGGVRANEKKSLRQKLSRVMGQKVADVSL
jgi:O-antigen/teichoic acid export membrane protein